MELHTRRLRLELLEPWHAEKLFEGLQHATLYDFIADAPPRSIEVLRERYATLASRQSPDGTEIWLNWAVWSLVEGRYVGYVQATITADGSAIIAYVFFQDAWGKGYAREAVTRMVHYLVEVHHVLDLRAYVDVRNHRSITLMRNLGFERIAVRKDGD